jgi:hypothetical protein
MQWQGGAPVLAKARASRQETTTRPSPYHFTTIDVYSDLITLQDAISGMEKGIKRLSLWLRRRPRSEVQVGGGEVGQTDSRPRLQSNVGFAEGGRSVNPFPGGSGGMGLIGSCSPL